MIDILEKNLLILASAGSGKTYQLGNRVIGMIGRQEVDPEKLVALTFTRKAAGEFLDSVLTKLAEGNGDPEKADEISSALGGPVNLDEVLERVVKALPRLQFTTLDGFFSRIVRGFQYELGLTGGTFDLLQGERLETAKAEILQGVLAEGFDERQDFYFAFRKAVLGRGSVGVQSSLEKVVEEWHTILKSGACAEHFGNPEVFGDLPEINDWAAQKDGMIAELRDDRLPKVWDTFLDQFSAHVVGTTPNFNALGKHVLEQINELGDVVVSNRGKDLVIPADTMLRLRCLHQLAVGCELRTAVAKTQAVGELIAQVDREHEQQLRRRGLLSFDDVKILLGEWSQSEEARLRRELIDYRLDGRYDHWLLDEFQDTSRAEWHALEPLVDEAVSDPQGSFFVVGDQKQGIYAWRGGDVSLFEQVQQHYNDGLTQATMDKSFRSCPAVLALVNAVCGNLPVIEQLFGKSVREQWQWRDHESSKPDQSGEAKVIELSKDDKGELLVEELRRLGIGEKKLSCGVLVRTGDQVKKYADLLRAEGFDVIEAGQRKPGEDHAVGVTITRLIRWLANPADDYSRGVLEMSPLFPLLEVEDDQWGKCWDGMLQEVQAIGYARFVSQLIAPAWAEIGPYGRRRAEDLIAALAQFDGTGEACPRAAASWIRDLEVSQAPGVAAIQVMTIHKSKGLGFDVVMLPELPDRDQIPVAKHFEVARGPNWLLQAPGKWAYEAHPETAAAFERWGEGQKYEALCLLYVALTRAKRGLYVFLPALPKSREGEKGEAHASPGNLVRRSTGIAFSESDPEWAKSVEDLETPAQKSQVTLAKATPQRRRKNPSSAKIKGASTGGSGRRIGSEVHQLFEEVAWLGTDEMPAMPYSAAGQIVEEALKVSAIHEIFEDKGAMLYREQPFELIDEGRWVSGVMDRLHVYREGDEISRIEVIDFKTDACESEEELAMRYLGQMESYRRAASQIFGVEKSCIRCLLVWTHGAKVIDLDGLNLQGKLTL